ncbi:hypothetical protein OG381_18450 [Streptomyces sp. NBC_00490]|uniref:hypothetical protein n=1 Tax=Streptomyces sp. NBC_00490 TaxID=2903657 RepID=UPI002E192EAC
MRALSARRLASAAVTATLLIGITAPAAVAVDNESQSERIEEAAKAPLPGVDGLLAQVQTLGSLGSVLAPVTDVLNAVLKADDGQVSPEQATQLLDAVKAAIAKATAAAPAPVPPPTDVPATTTPATPPATTTPTDALPLPLPVPALPLPADKSADDAKAPSADAVGDALATLQTAVGDLLAAATSGDPTKVAPAATKVVSSLLNAVVALLLGGGLPLPLPGDLPVPAPPLPVPLPLPAS